MVKATFTDVQDMEEFVGLITLMKGERPRVTAQSPSGCDYVIFTVKFKW